ncbi:MULTISPECIES: hypothetical protein [Paenibacillus]|uniref:hypothetical protein n=1 Tax=Paenibacillus TaxID=44249 RepID=UPI0022B88CBD|nr:hypothetical protein [Paenibacillus caseinilyticus]MCZ8522504.1 hypothetical protein [Paenibacillus caseinilyticus]
MSLTRMAEGMAKAIRRLRRWPVLPGLRRLRPGEQAARLRRLRPGEQAARLRRLRYGLLAACLLLGSCGPAGERPATPGLLAGLTFAKSHILLENGNDFVWNGVTITLNGRYVYRTDSMPRGTSALPFDEFRDRDGHSFDRSRMTPHDLVIDAAAGFDGQPGRYEW